MVETPAPIFMPLDTLDRLQDEDKFCRIVVDTFGELCGLARLTPEFEPDLMHDAWEAFNWDTQRLVTNMSSKSPEPVEPDHFKICGFAAYWLRRHSPVSVLMEDKGLKVTKDEVIKEWRRLFGSYSRALLAFYFGYRICYFYETRGESDSVSPRKPDSAYIEAICYVMKYKSLSPHAMGMIYRSLFYNGGK